VLWNVAAPCDSVVEPRAERHRCGERLALDCTEHSGLSRLRWSFASPSWRLKRDVLKLLLLLWRLAPWLDLDPGVTDQAGPADPSRRTCSQLFVEDLQRLGQGLPCGCECCGLPNRERKEEMWKAVEDVEVAAVRPARAFTTFRMQQERRHVLDTAIWT
jgi:hypothetical protein